MILIENKTRKGRSYYLNINHELVAQACITCDDIFPICEFNKASNKPFGVHTECKGCNQKYKKEYQKTDRCKQLVKRNAQKHKAKIAAYQKRYRAAHKERLYEEKLKWQRANKEKVNQRCKNWVAQNKERRAEICRKSAIKCKDRKNTYRREYRKLKPEIRNDWRIDKNLGHVKYFLKEVNKLRLKIRKLNQGKSASDHFTVDHIIPLIHPDICGLNCPANLQVLTRSENAFKKNRWDGTDSNESWRAEYEKVRAQENE